MVLDSSVTLAWFLPDEHSTVTGELMDRVTADGAIVPSLWSIEIGNAFLTAQRRRRVSTAERIRALQLIGRLPIEIAPETGKQAWFATFELAEQHRLTLYDAVYLELAIRRNLPLASLDAALCRAAEAAGVAMAAG